MYSISNDVGLRMIAPFSTARRIVVAGVSLRGSGYPNAWNTLRILREQGVAILECGEWLPEDFHLWKLTRIPRWRAAFAIMKLISGNAISAIRLLMHRGRDDIIYVPYPGIFLLWALSWLPLRWRPACTCDAYITVWDSLYQDREIGGKITSRVSKLLLRIESRALRAATRVVVDTTANADHIATTFGLDRHRVYALPLATDDALIMPQIRPAQTRTTDHPIRVLFFGTFVPLQGTTKIAQALDLLRDRIDLEFIVLGDGQTAVAAEPYLLNHPGVTWLRDWLPIEELKRRVNESDICLGIFGGEGKASRVLPFKLYIAMAAGKPIVTQQLYGLPDGCPPIPAHFTSATPLAIAEGILSLAENVQLRNELGERARIYYIQHLGQENIASRWQEWVRSTDN
ncbi:hypothetical protein HEP73_01088 [Xanthomonas sp. GW]|nr:hypothetical protein HEP73_01088 [Xanthomonas sp. GW]